MNITTDNKTTNGCPYKKDIECQKKEERMPAGINRRLTPYERTRRTVYATGNKWAIENFHATHD